MSTIALQLANDKSKIRNLSFRPLVKNHLRSASQPLQPKIINSNPFLFSQTEISQSQATLQTITDHNMISNNSNRNENDLNTHFFQQCDQDMKPGQIFTIHQFTNTEDENFVCMSVPDEYLDINEEQEDDEDDEQIEEINFQQFHNNSNSLTHNQQSSINTGTNRAGSSELNFYDQHLISQNPTIQQTTTLKNDHCFQGTTLININDQLTTKSQSQDQQEHQFLNLKQTTQNALETFNTQEESKMEQQSLLKEVNFNKSGLISQRINSSFHEFIQQSQKQKSQSPRNSQLTSLQEFNQNNFIQFTNKKQNNQDGNRLKNNQSKSEEYVTDTSSQDNIINCNNNGIYIREKYLKDQPLNIHINLNKNDSNIDFDNQKIGFHQRYHSLNSKQSDTQSVKQYKDNLQIELFSNQNLENFVERDLGGTISANSNNSNDTSPRSALHQAQKITDYSINRDKIVANAQKLSQSIIQHSKNSRAVKDQQHIQKNSSFDYKLQSDSSPQTNGKILRGLQINVEEYVRLKQLRLQELYQANEIIYEEEDLAEGFTTQNSVLSRQPATLSNDDIQKFAKEEKDSQKEQLMQQIEGLFNNKMQSDITKLRDQINQLEGVIKNKQSLLQQMVDKQYESKFSITKDSQQTNQALSQSVNRKSQTYLFKGQQQCTSSGNIPKNGELKVTQNQSQENIKRDLQPSTQHSMISQFCRSLRSERTKTRKMFKSEANIQINTTREQQQQNQLKSLRFSNTSLISDLSQYNVSSSKTQSPKFIQKDQESAFSWVVKSQGKENNIKNTSNFDSTLNVLEKLREFSKSKNCSQLFKTEKTKAESKQNKENQSQRSQQPKTTNFNILPGSQYQNQIKKSLLTNTTPSTQSYLQQQAQINQDQNSKIKNNSAVSRRLSIEKIKIQNQYNSKYGISTNKGSLKSGISVKNYK
eukprot:403345786